jgi:hypothetical protein
MNQLVTRSAFEMSSLPAFRIGGKSFSKVRERRVIVAALADGTTRELRVEIDFDPERPFRVPTAIAGQFRDIATSSLIVEMKDRTVAVDGRRYRFTKIDNNGSFKLRKGW